ncbi:MAG: C13 family peptidase [Steroidobacteraceae bacterium]|jgi:hypothetical protein
MSEHDPDQPQAPPASPGAAALAAPDPEDWWKALLRLWSLRATGAIRATQSPAVTLILACCSIALWIAIDRWESRPDPQFVAANIPLLAWYAVAAQALAAVLCRQSRPSPSYAAALALVSGLVPILVALVTVAVVYFDEVTVQDICWICGAYSLAYLARGLRALTGRSQYWPSFAGALCIGAFIWLSDALNVIPDVWNSVDAQATSADDARADDEALLFEQAARIDRSLAQVHRDASPKPEAFFLGFAGVGDEKVFAGEIGLAAKVLGERYGFANRRVYLINDERDLQREPLATVSGLKYALREIGARMRLDRDVLFLSISSHGSRDAVIAVSNSDLPLKDLYDEDLADALRESGIRWRVIIISACYSGAFIDSLRDARTIVIAAAAADRTSFGCSNDRDLTYFGEAFYRDALPGAHSLREAFDEAKASLALREQQERVTPSDPQAFFGGEIEAKLAEDGRAAAH